MIIKGVETTIEGRMVATKFPDTSILILKSALALDVIHIIECMLNYDFASIYEYTDEKAYNIRYRKIDSSVKLFLTDTDLYIHNSSVVSTDSNHNIHTIRYLKQGIYRSCFINNYKGMTNLGKNINKYSDLFEYKVWCRIVELTNQLIGDEFVAVEPNKLSFNFDKTGSWNEESAKFVYMLIAESYLLEHTTQRRVFLLPNIVDIMTKEQALALFDTLKGIKGEVLIISDIDFTFNELVGRKDIKLISI